MFFKSNFIYMLCSVYKQKSHRNAMALKLYSEVIYLLITGLMQVLQVQQHQELYL